MQRLTQFMLAFVLMLLGMGAAQAAQLAGGKSGSRSAGAFALHSTTVKPAPTRRLKLAQTYTPNSRQPIKPPPTTKPPKRPKQPNPNIGIGISIGIGIIDAINKRPKQPPQKYKPRPKPKPKYTRKPPKKIYRKPPKPPVRTVRPRQPRQPVIPVVAPIPEFFPNEVVVLIDGDVSVADQTAIGQTRGMTRLSATPISLLEGQLVRYRVPSSLTVQQAVAALVSDPRVNLAQPNNIYLTVQQKSRKASAIAQYSLAKLGLVSAHEIAQGRGVAVAVIDTGVDTSHPELAGTVGQSFDAVQIGTPQPQSHGTAIAGLIAGRSKVRGVAPQANLMAARAFYMHPTYKREVTSTEILLRAFDWSVQNSARIFNMSFAGPFDPLVQAALTAAANKGIILIAAAGNGGPKAKPAYPAAYKNVIAITAVDRADKLYMHANRGPYLAAAAPGVDLLVPSLRRGYKYSSGTSLAAAHVSGIAALLLERNPNATATDILRAIQETAHDLGPKGHDAQFGAGRANAHASILSLKSDGVVLTSGQ